MRTVGHNGNPAQGFLDVSLRPEQMCFAFDRRMDLIIIAHDSAQVHRNDGFRVFINGICHLRIIHFEGSRLGINQANRGSEMNGG